MEELFAREEYAPCDICRTSRRYNHEYKPSSWFREVKAEPLSTNKAIAKAERMAKKIAASKLMMSCHPTGTLSVERMNQILSKWEASHQFVPDVVVIDYADLLAFGAGRMDYRHQINEVWKAMRALSQSWHCLVLTATQADAASYDSSFVVERNYSEDKRKYSHVSMIITLNQTPMEKAESVLRIGRMFVREDDYSSRKFTTVLDGRVVGRPYLGSL